MGQLSGHFELYLFVPQAPVPWAHLGQNCLQQSLHGLLGHHIRRKSALTGSTWAQDLGPRDQGLRPGDRGLVDKGPCRAQDQWTRAQGPSPVDTGPCRPQDQRTRAQGPGAVDKGPGPIHDPWTSPYGGRTGPPAQHPKETEVAPHLDSTPSRQNCHGRTR